MANELIMGKHRLYVAWIVYLYVTGQDNAYESFKNVYGASHVQQSDESDLDYVCRCAEQDYWDGSDDAAVYQEVFDALSVIGEPPTQKAKDEPAAFHKM